MNEPANAGGSRAESLKAGDEYGFYKIVEWSPARIFLRADYGTGLLLLVAAIVILLLDIMIFGNAHTIVGIMRLFRLYMFLGFRDFLISLPTAVKVAMFILPIIGFSWFFFMTGRSTVVDFTRKIASKVKFFFLGDKVNLGSVASLQLRINPFHTPTGGDWVYLHFLDAKKQSLMEFQDESACEEEILSSPTTDYAKMLALAVYVAQTLRVPITKHGKPSKMSIMNRRMLEAACPAA